jgi:hypothetical protein
MRSTRFANATGNQGSTFRQQVECLGTEPLLRRFGGVSLSGFPALRSQQQSAVRAATGGRNVKDAERCARCAFSGAAASLAKGFGIGVPSFGQRPICGPAGGPRRLVCAAVVPHTRGHGNKHRGVGGRAPSWDSRAHLRIGRRAMRRGAQIERKECQREDPKLFSLRPGAVARFRFCRTCTYSALPAGKRLVRVAGVPKPMDRAAWAAEAGGTGGRGTAALLGLAARPFQASHARYRIQRRLHSQGRTNRFESFCGQSGSRALLRSRSSECEAATSEAIGIGSGPALLRWRRADTNGSRGHYASAFRGVFRSQIGAAGGVAGWIGLSFSGVFVGSVGKSLFMSGLWRIRIFPGAVGHGFGSPVGEFAARAICGYKTERKRPGR